MLKNFRSLIPKAFNVQFVSVPLAGALNYGFHSSQSLKGGKATYGETL